MKKILLILVAATLSLSAKAQEYVDLGLSVYWATYDVGATSPYEHGTTFVPGTTTQAPLRVKYGVYKIDRQEDFSGNAEYDAATATWGQGWRTPTYMEWCELMGCTWTAEKIKINGKKVWGSRVIGQNGNSIFLPVTFWGYSCSTPTDHGLWIFSHNGAGIHGLFATDKPSHSYKKIVSVRAVRDK